MLENLIETKQLFLTMLVIATLVVASSESFSAFVTAPQPAADCTARATYDPATGDLFFSIGAHVELVALGATGLIDTTKSPSLGAKLSDQYDANVLAYFDFSAAALPVGIFAQGAILPAGLNSVEGLLFNYQSCGDPIPSIVDIIRPVPEPATIGFLGLGLMGASCVRSRRYQRFFHA